MSDLIWTGALNDPYRLGGSVGDARFADRQGGGAAAGPGGARANGRSVQCAITNRTFGKAEGVKTRGDIRNKKETRYQCQGGSQYQPGH
jgi:hypothetical protein